MPTYEFVCTGCGRFSEVRASLAQKDAGLSPTCPACGSGELRRAFSTVGLVGTRSAAAQNPDVVGGRGCCGGACGC